MVHGIRSRRNGSICNRQGAGGNPPAPFCLWKEPLVVLFRSRRNKKSAKALTLPIFVERETGIEPAGISLGS